LLWPSDDGHAWQYRAIERGWDPPQPVVFADLAHVPPITMDTVAAVLASRPVGANPFADTSKVRLQFAGTTTLPSGIGVQVLEEIDLLALARTSPSRRWLADLAVARPDLRGRLGASPASLAPHGLALTGQPMFLHSGLWRRTAQWIGSYHAAATDTNPDWKFLEADQTPGHRFFVQLLPDLAPDVILWGQVARQFSVN